MRTRSFRVYSGEVVGYRDYKVLHGAWVWWNHKGVVRFKSNFENGKLIA